MVGFSNSSSPHEPNLDRKTGPYLAFDISCRNSVIVCDGCMRDIEDPSLHLDSVLAKVSIYDGVGYT